MTEGAVHFREIEVHLVLGIGRDQGFTLSDLSEGVNLVYGPNGSGKSTTARAIQELLWPGRTGLDRPSMSGTLDDGGKSWRIEIDAGNPTSSCDGRIGIVPEWGPPENRHRYRLALHELITDENSDFAKIIADASQGGYDLDAAGNALGFRKRPKFRRNLRRELQHFQREVDQTRRHQQGIEQRAAELAGLRERRDRAIEAIAEIDRLNKAQEYYDAVEQCRTLRLELDPIPDGVALLHGDEREKLDDLKNREEELQNARVAEQKQIESADRQLLELQLGDDGVDHDVLMRVRGWERRLREVESDNRRLQEELSRAKTQIGEAQARLGSAFTQEQLDRIDTLKVGELSRFARRADALRAEEQVLAEQRRRLERDEPDEVRGLDRKQLSDGVTALGHWLAAPPPPPRSPARYSFPVIVAGAVILAFGMGLAFVQHWAWALSGLIAVGVVAADCWIRRSAEGGTGADFREVHKQSYEATKLEEPDEWEFCTVQRLMHHIMHLATIRDQEDERIRRLGDLEEETEAHDERQGKFRNEHQELESRLGIDLTLENEWLPLLVDNIGIWQRQRGDAAAAQKVVADLDEEQADLLSRLNGKLGAFSYGEVDSAEATAQAIEDLDRRQSSYSAAVSERADAQRQIENTVDPELERVSEARRVIFDRLGIEEAEEHRINDWLSERPEYLERKNALAEAETIREDRKQGLSEHEDYLELTPVEIQQQIAAEQEIADQRDELSEKIAGIGHDIEAAKVGHELSNALEARDAARERLADAREENCRSVVGDLLTSWIREVAVDRSRPDVFRRSNEILVRFTSGTLQLLLDDRVTPPVFRARLGTQPARPVDLLSIGERVQLLMAVRMAFLEYAEPARLPLLLDEALGTSDDERAGTIIDSVVEIARQGRQIFYFTAQNDEVGKWVARVGESGVPMKVINLAEVRRLAAAGARPLQIAAVEASTLPAPDGMSYDNYAAALGISGLDPADEGLDGLHLWHVLDDADFLYSLLSKNIRTWGQLRTLIDHGGVGIVDVEDARIGRAAVVAKAIKTACDGWRIGRGKAVDRAALQDSGCVSNNFIDELSQLTQGQEVAGDARGIMDALEHGRVARWRTKNTAPLREYFEENGYLADTVPLQPDEIRVRVIAAAKEGIHSGQIDQAKIDKVIGSLLFGS